ncbi:MAG: type II secretion system protein [Sedimentisphaerales bacterium]|nr:type II secretion system protein [Sedimentisphaerales bacterium]
MTYRKQGFTLIELLVVVSIIALLVSILLPALNSARSRAQTVVCAANLKNYGLALEMYTQENEGWTPSAWYWLYTSDTITLAGNNYGVPTYCMWHFDELEPDGSLWPYLEGKDVHMCPTFESLSRSTGCPNCNGSLPFHPVYSYSMNVWIGLDWEKTSRTIKLTKVDRPSECVSFSEENLWTINVANGDDINYSGAVLNDNVLWLTRGPTMYVDNFATYHNVNRNNRNEGKANAVFMDSHVELIRGEPYDQSYIKFGQPWSGHKYLEPKT